MLGRGVLKVQCHAADATKMFENLGWALLSMAGGALALLTTLLVHQAR